MNIHLKTFSFKKNCFSSLLFTNSEKVEGWKFFLISRWNSFFYMPSCLWSLLILNPKYSCWINVHGFPLCKDYIPFVYYHPKSCQRDWLWGKLSLALVGFPGGSEGKASACNAGDPGSIPESGRSPREGNDNPLQYSCFESSMDEGAW